MQLNKKIERLNFYLIIFSFTLVTLIWSIFIPVLEAPDESGHYAYIKFILDHKSLPVLPYPWGDNSLYHPPLYFLTLTPILKLIGEPDYDVNVNLSPEWETGKSINAFVHSKEELSLNWTKSIQTVHLLRISSIIISVLSVFLIYNLIKLYFGSSVLTPLTTLFAVFNPQFIFHSSVITNDSLAIFLSTFLLFLLIKNISSLKLDLKREIVIGAILGLAIMTKQNLLFLGIIVFAWIMLNSKALSDSIKKTIFIILGTLSVAGWYFIRNIRLYNEPFGTSGQLEMFSIFANTRNGFDLWYDVMRFLITTFKTYWGAFGWYTIYFPYIYYIIIGLFISLGLSGTFYYLYKNKTFIFASTFNKRLIFSLFSVLILFISLLITYLKYPVVGNGRFLFPVIGPASLVVIFGANHIFKRITVSKTYLPFVTVLAAILNLSILFLFILPKY